MFGKLFASTYTGSMVGSGLNVFAVWGYVIANTKPDGHVELNPPIIAATLGCSVEQVEDAIKVLCAPDARSRNAKEEGRRLVQKSAFMYFVPTYSDYRAMRDDSDRREYMRGYMRDYRAGKIGGSAKKPDEDKPDPVVKPTKKKPAGPACLHEAIIEEYHRLLPMNPKVRVWSDKSAKHMATRWAEDEARQNLEWWAKTFTYIADHCPFLIGGKTDFRASLSWIVNAENMAKILNGNYEVDAK